MLFRSAIKLAAGNAAIDAISGEPMSKERTLAQVAPAAIAPAFRAVKGIVGLASTAAKEGPKAAWEQFLGTAKTPEQQAMVAEMPELFPTKPTINVRTPADFLEEAGITRGASTTTLPEPKDNFRFKTITKAQEKMYPEMRSAIGYLGSRDNPASQELSKRFRLLNDVNRELQVTGKQISAEVMGRLSPAEQDQLHRYMI